MSLNSRNCMKCKKNLDISNFYKNQYKCKVCHKLWMRHYRRTFRGFLDQKYTAMSKRVRGKDRNCLFTVAGLPIITREQFLTWSYEQKELPALFEAYKDSNWDFKLCPTIDRIDSTKGYIFGNIQYLTQSNNSKKNKGIKRIKRIVNMNVNLHNNTTGAIL